MSPALKSAVWARGPASNTVMRPSPLIQYCHSSALGCQCSSRIPPGWTVTIAIATLVETLNVLESTMRTSPPFVRLVGGISIVRKAKSRGDFPSAPAAAFWSASSGPGTAVWKMNSSCLGRFFKEASATPKFFDRTAGGRCAIESLSNTVSDSEKSPSSNTSMNSAPSGSSPWIEWGTPLGKYHRSFFFTSATKLLPPASMAVIRAVPYSMIAHSPAVCQCSSRTPPAVSLIFTPAIDFETGNSRTVTSRDHPPSYTRLLAREKGYLNVGTKLLESVPGGHAES